jgi:uncharacterized protein YdeI (YjbR/CyaY-like superfamily)
MDPAVDNYLVNSVQWPREIAALRPILLGCGLTESIKWQKPCYGVNGKNIVIMQEMKAHLALMFFHGALLDDRHGVLEDQGPNSRSARRMTFTTVDSVNQRAAVIEELVGQAVAMEDAGHASPPAAELELVAELKARLDGDSALREAFESLTPGRQRHYNLHIAGAKRPATRESRIDRCIPHILAGKGLRDR